MEEKRLVAEWLLEYACYHHMTSVLHVYSKHDMENESEENLSATILGSTSGAIPARYMLATLKTIVDKDKVDDYEIALQILGRLSLATKSHLPSKEFIKCATGLKILNLFHHLRLNSKRSIPLLNQYFPKQGGLHSETPKIAETQKAFRSFFLPLATNAEEGQKYITERFEKDFGSAFVKGLKTRIRDFVILIEKLLPTPVLSKFINEPEVLKKLKCLNSPSLTTFVEGLEGKAKLSEHDVLVLLTSVLHKHTRNRQEKGTSPSPKTIESPESGKESTQDKSCNNVESPSRGPKEQSTVTILPDKERDLQSDITSDVTPDVTPTTLTIIPLQTQTTRVGSYTADSATSSNKTLYLTARTQLSTQGSSSTTSAEQGREETTGISSDDDILSPSPQHSRTGTKLMSSSGFSVLSFRENPGEKMQHSPGKNPESPKKGISIASEEQSMSSKGRLGLGYQTGQATSSAFMTSPSKSDRKHMASPTKGPTSLGTSPRRDPIQQAESFAKHLNTFRLKMACPVELHDIANNNVPRKTDSNTNDVEPPATTNYVHQRSAAGQLSSLGSPTTSPIIGSVTSDDSHESPHRAGSSPRKDQSSPGKRSSDEVPLLDEPLKAPLSPRKGHAGSNKRVSWSDELIQISSPEPGSPNKVVASPAKQCASPRKMTETTSREPSSADIIRSSLSKNMGRNITDITPIPSIRPASPVKVLTSPLKQLPSPSKVLASPNESNLPETHGDQSQSPLKSSGELFLTSDESDRGREGSSPDNYAASPRKRYRQYKAPASPDIDISSPESPRKRQKRHGAPSSDAVTDICSPSTSNEGVSSPNQVLGSSVCSAKSGGQESDDEWHSCVDDADSQKSRDVIDIEAGSGSNAYTDDVRPGMVPSSNSFERQIQQAVNPKDEFLQWCENALRGILQSSVDVPTFIELLQNVDSIDEVNDYLDPYLSKGKDAKKFATQFLTRRSKLENLKDQDMYTTVCDTTGELANLAVPDIQPSRYPEVSRKCIIKLCATDYQGLKEKIYN